ncbi:MAG: hypothetical protein M5R40_26445 [Anaerolineae bacterium]|nr:hypothetical protein [Anaerolineae bacterium]
MEDETNGTPRRVGRTILYIVIGIIIVNLVVSVTFRWLLKNRPEVIPANVREAIAKAEAEAKAQKQAAAG